MSNYGIWAQPGHIREAPEVTSASEVQLSSAHPVVTHCQMKWHVQLDTARPREPDAARGGAGLPDLARAASLSPAGLALRGVLVVCSALSRRPAGLLLASVIVHDVMRPSRNG